MFASSSVTICFTKRICEIRTMDVNQCLNCDTHLSKTQNFCSTCGQAASTHRFTVFSFFHEGFHAATHADKGIFHLLKELAIRPGVVAREYIEGKRKKYFNPFTFFLLLMALFVSAQTLLSSRTTTVEKGVPASITQIRDPQLKETMIIRYHRGMEARAFTAKNGNILAMFAIPLFALYFWLIFYRREYNYPEHLVASLLFVTFANLAFTLVVVPLQLALKGSPWGIWMPMVGFLLQAFYLTIAYKGMMKLKGFWSVSKMALLSVIAILLWAILSASAIAIYVVRSIHFYEYFTHMGR
jgi:hypothetical protein